MDICNNGKVTRRKFVKGVAGAAVCCACFSLDRLSASENSTPEVEDDKDGRGKEHLVGACGIYCGICPAYTNKHGRDKKKFPPEPVNNSIDGFVSYMNKIECDGCLSGGKLTGHCQNCSIRLCAAEKQENHRCSDCEELPCHRLTNLINQGNYPHRQEYLPNLKKIREMGVQEFARYEDARWRCPRCGQPLSWYDAKCPGCGAPRSERLFPLPEK